MGKELEVEKLTGSQNYHTWAFAIKNWLEYKGYGKCIEAERDKVTGEVVTDKNTGVVIILEKKRSQIEGLQGLTGSLCGKKHLYTHRKMYYSYPESSTVHKVGRHGKHVKLYRLCDGRCRQAKGIGFGITDEWIVII